MNTPTKKYSFQGKRYKITKDKFSEFDVNLAQNASKVFYNTNFKGNIEETDNNLSQRLLSEPDLEIFIEVFTEAIQSACEQTFKTLSITGGTTRKKSVPWWTETLTIMRQRTNALRKRYKKLETTTN